MAGKGSQKKLSRRDFLKGAAMGTGVIAVGFSPGKAAAKTDLPERWHIDADVVIVGFGGAGACAAIEAHDAGAKVLLLEKQPKETHYPNTRMSGGIFHSPDPTGDKNALKEYALAMFSGDNLPWKLEGEQPHDIAMGLAEAWAEYTPGNLDFLKKVDPEFKTVPMSGFSGAAFPQFPGAKESKYRVFGSTFTVRASLDTPSKDLPKSEKMNGEAFFAVLRGGVERRGIPVSYSTPAKGLVMSKDGEIIGVVAEQGGKDIAAKAKKAVIITSGGYEYNP
ncbi:MAG TPA: FAD-binding protein, partial [Thermodesulfobacteriota bacterium]|nr:FAD-binding protein [Thermodesulfobacteriota bacterium]